MMDSPGFAEMVLEGHEVGPTRPTSTVMPVGRSDGVEAAGSEGPDPGPLSRSWGNSFAQAERPASASTSAATDLRLSTATG